MNLALRFGMAASLAVSAASHAVLYVHGYREIPVIGRGFLVQASVFAALAVLIARGDQRRCRATHPLALPRRRVARLAIIESPVVQTRRTVPDRGRQ